MQPPLRGCVLKQTLANLSKVRLEQPPLRGCVLKLKCSR